MVSCPLQIDTRTFPGFELLPFWSFDAISSHLLVVSVDVPNSSFIVFLSGRWWSKLPSTYFFHTMKVCLSTALLCYWSAVSLELVSLFHGWHLNLLNGVPYLLLHCTKGWSLEMYYEGHNFSYDTLLSFSKEYFQLKVRMLFLMCAFLDNQFLFCDCGQL